jgi:riboflavin kinase/FMN adenylyltransferase
VKEVNGKIIHERSTVALGLFDGVHAGHRAVIRRAAEIAEKNGGDSVVWTMCGAPELPKLGGRKDSYLMSVSDKVGEIERAGAEDGFIVSARFEDIRGFSPREFFDKEIIKRLDASCVVCGEDFRFGKDGAGDAALLSSMCKEAGIAFETVPPVCIDGEKVSSTLIRDFIRNGDIPAADKLLGHGFYYTLPVVRGRQLGRTIGFPTVNQEIPQYMVRPKRGVYAAFASIGEHIFPFGPGKLYPAITNIGVKPTVKSDGAENMETHIIGFDGDIYDKAVRVYLRSFIRDERRFSGLDELKAQLEADKSRVLTQK